MVKSTEFSVVTGAFSYTGIGVANNHYRRNVAYSDVHVLPVSSPGREGNGRALWQQVYGLPAECANVYTSARREISGNRQTMMGKRIRKSG